MAKSNAAAASRRLAVVHPHATSRIARAAEQLVGLPNVTVDERTIEDLAHRFGVRPLIKALETKRDELNGRICTMIRHEGEEDEKGKIRYQTDAFKFIIIPGKNSYINEAKLRKAMVGAGLTPRQIEKIVEKSGCKSVTEYEYPGVFPITDEDEMVGDQDHKAKRRGAS